MLEKIKEKAKAIKLEIKVLYLAYKDKDTPWYAKVVAAMVVAYAVSPIDLIPDFIPVLGYLDDLLLLPLGIALAIKLIPKDILNKYRELAKEQTNKEKPNIIWGAIIIVIIWCIIGYLIIKNFKFSIVKPS